jgi:arylsulfatase A-like enzyme
MFSALDIMPTVASMTGTKMLDVISDGYDQSGNLLSGTESPRDFVPVFMRGSLVGFRKGDYKLVFKGVELVTNGNKTHKPDMYNLAEDPSETKNLSEKEPEKYAEMVKAAKDYLDSIGTPAAPLCDFDD